MAINDCFVHNSRFHVDFVNANYDIIYHGADDVERNEKSLAETVAVLALEQGNGEQEVVVPFEKILGENKWLPTPIRGILNWRPGYLMYQRPNEVPSGISDMTAREIVVAWIIVHSSQI